MESRGILCGHNTEILMFSLVVNIVTIGLYKYFLFQNMIMAVYFLLDLNAIGPQITHFLSEYIPAWKSL